MTIEPDIAVDVSADVIRSLLQANFERLPLHQMAVQVLVTSNLDLRLRVAEILDVDIGDATTTASGGLEAAVSVSVRAEIQSARLTEVVAQGAPPSTYFGLAHGNNRAECRLDLLFAGKVVVRLAKPLEGRFTASNRQQLRAIIRDSAVVEEMSSRLAEVFAPELRALCVGMGGYISPLPIIETAPEYQPGGGQYRPSDPTKWDVVLKMPEIADDGVREWVRRSGSYEERGTSFQGLPASMHSEGFFPMSVVQLLGAIERKATGDDSWPPRIAHVPTEKFVRVSAAAVAELGLGLSKAFGRHPEASISFEGAEFVQVKGVGDENVPDSFAALRDFYVKNGDSADAVASFLNVLLAIRFEDFPRHENSMSDALQVGVLSRTAISAISTHLHSPEFYDDLFDSVSAKLGIYHVEQYGPVGSYLRAAFRSQCWDAKLSQQDSHVWGAASRAGPILYECLRPFLVAGLKVQLPPEVAHGGLRVLVTTPPSATTWTASTEPYPDETLEAGPVASFAFSERWLGNASKMNWLLFIYHLQAFADWDQLIGADGLHYNGSADITDADNVGAGNAIQILDPTSLVSYPGLNRLWIERAEFGLGEPALQFPTSGSIMKTVRAAALVWNTEYADDWVTLASTYGYYEHSWHFSPLGRIFVERTKGELDSPFADQGAWGEFLNATLAVVADIFTLGLADLPWDSAHSTLVDKAPSTVGEGAGPGLSALMFTAETVCSVVSGLLGAAAHVTWQNTRVVWVGSALALRVSGLVEGIRPDVVQTGVDETSVVLGLIHGGLLPFASTDVNSGTAVLHHPWVATPDSSLFVTSFATATGAQTGPSFSNTDAPWSPTTTTSSLYLVPQGEGPNVPDLVSSVPGGAANPTCWSAQALTPMLQDAGAEALDLGLLHVPAMHFQAVSDSDVDTITPGGVPYRAAQPGAGSTSGAVGEADTTPQAILRLPLSMFGSRFDKTGRVITLVGRDPLSPEVVVAITLDRIAEAARFVGADGPAHRVSAYQGPSAGSGLVAKCSGAAVLTPEAITADWIRVRVAGDDWASVFGVVYSLDGYVHVGPGGVARIQDFTNQQLWQVWTYRVRRLLPVPPTYRVGAALECSASASKYKGALQRDYTVPNAYKTATEVFTRVYRIEPLDVRADLVRAINLAPLWSYLFRVTIRDDWGAIVTRDVVTPYGAFGSASGPARARTPVGSQGLLTHLGQYLADEKFPASGPYPYDVSADVRGTIDCNSITQHGVVVEFWLTTRGDAAASNGLTGVLDGGYTFERAVTLAVVVRSIMVRCNLSVSVELLDGDGTTPYLDERSAPIVVSTSLLVEPRVQSFSDGPLHELAAGESIPSVLRTCGTVDPATGLVYEWTTPAQSDKVPWGKDSDVRKLFRPFVDPVHAPAPRSERPFDGAPSFPDRRVPGPRKPR